MEATTLGLQCDRTFNLLKAEYHKRNIFTVEDLVSILNTHALVSAMDAPPFLEWDKYLDQLYTRPRSIKKWHCFQLEAKEGDYVSRSTTIKTRRSDATDDCEVYDISRRDVNRRDELLKQLPLPAAKPGIRIIKRHELSEKYAPLVPPEYRNRSIYAPLDTEEARRFKEEQTKNNKDKREARERSKRKAPP